MKILRWTRKVLRASAKRVGKFLDYAGAGIVNSQHGLTVEEYEAEGIVDVRSTDALSPGLTGKQKLETAAEALRRIARLTKNNPAIDHYYGRAIHKIASDGYEASK